MENTTSTILQALARMLRPIVRILLLNKVSYQAFDQVARQVFVEVADQHFGVPGRAQTNSRIGVVTGLSRKEVLRLKRLPPLADRDLPVQFQRVARLVSIWTSEQRYMDESGQPLPLPYDGSHSFSTLVERAGGDVTPRTMLDELSTAGMIDVSPDRQVKLLRRAYVPSDDATQMLRLLGTDVGDLANTIVHNFSVSGDASRFQMKVSYDNLPQECLGRFHQLVSERGYQVLVEFDRWLREQDRDVNPEVQGTGCVRAGVGIYYFEETEEVS